MCLLTPICSRTPSGQTQPCPLGREVDTSVIFQCNAWENGHSLKWCVMCDTYRHSGSWQRLTWSLVYKCTCSFLWCWDIQHSYRSQATGTHWCLWNTQSSVISSTFWLWKYHEVVFSQEFVSNSQWTPQPNLVQVSVSDLAYRFSHWVFRDWWQNIAIDHVVKPTSCWELTTETSRFHNWMKAKRSDDMRETCTINLTTVNQNALY